MKKLFLFLASVLCTLMVYAQTQELRLLAGPWSADDAKFAAWYWETGEEAQFSDFFAPIKEENDTLAVEINAAADNVIFVRLNSAAETPDWDFMWNQTGDLSIESNLFKATGYANDELIGEWVVKQNDPQDPEDPEDPQPEEKNYYLVGGFCSWNPAKAVEFTKEDEGYSLSLAELSGTFKVIDAQDWEHGIYGAHNEGDAVAFEGKYNLKEGDQSQNISLGGTYTNVVLMLTEAEGVLTLHFVSGTYVEKKYYLVGDFNDWVETEAVPFAKEEGVYTLSLDVPLFGKFKVIDAQDWKHGIYAAHTEGDAVALEGEYNLEEYGDNLSVSGNYTNVVLTLTESANGLTLHFVSGTLVETQYYLVGDFNNWEPAEALAFTKNEGGYSLSLDAFSGLFKVIDAQDWKHGVYGGYNENDAVAFEGEYNLLASGASKNLSLDGAYTDVTLSLTIENNVVTLHFVSGTAATTPPAPEENVTVYFVNKDDWTNLKAHVWKMEGETPDDYFVWDEDEAMTLTESQANEKEVYSYTFPQEYPNIIFHGDNGNQTADLTVEADKPYYYDGVWYTSLDEIPALTVPSAPVFSLMGSFNGWTTPVPFNGTSLSMENLSGSFVILKVQDEQTTVYRRHQEGNIVVDENTYNLQEGADDENISLAFAYSSVTFSIEVENENVKLSLQGVRMNMASAPTDLQFYLVGDFCNWIPAEAVAFTRTDNNYSLELENLAGGFKVIDAQDWLHSIYGGYTEGDAVAFEGEYNLMAGGASKNLSVAEGYTDITLTLTLEDGVVTLHFVSGTEAGTPPAPEQHFYLVGDFNDWNTAEAVAFEETAEGFSLTLAELSGEFKVIDAQDWDHGIYGGYTEGDAVAFEGEYNLQASGASKNLSLDGAYTDVTLSLTIENNVVTLHFVSGTAATTPPAPEENVIVYFVNKDDWTNLKAHVWKMEGETPDDYFVWDEDEAMTLTESQANEKEVYSYTFPQEYPNIIFHGDNGNQTADLTLEAGKPYYYDGVWYTSLDEIPAPATPVEMVDISLVPNIWNVTGVAAKFAAVTWKEGETMFANGVLSAWFEGDDELVVGRIPADADSIAFARFDGALQTPTLDLNVIWNHTDYLKIDPSMKFTILDWQVEEDGSCIGYWGDEIPEAEWFLCGDMSNWEKYTLPFANGSVTVNLSDEGRTYAFKVIKLFCGRNTWYGNDGTMDRVYHEEWIFTTSMDNARLITDIAGDYTFAFVEDGNAIKVTVTYPEQHETGLEQLMLHSGMTKMLHNGLIYIVREGRLYNAMGQKIR